MSDYGGLFTKLFDDNGNVALWGDNEAPTPLMSAQLMLELQHEKEDRLKEERLRQEQEQVQGNQALYSQPSSAWMQAAQGAHTQDDQNFTDTLLAPVHYAGDKFNSLLSAVEDPWTRAKTALSGLVSEHNPFTSFAENTLEDNEPRTYQGDFSPGVGSYVSSPAHERTSGISNFLYNNASSGHLQNQGEVITRAMYGEPEVGDNVATRIARPLTRLGTDLGTNISNVLPLAPGLGNKYSWGPIVDVLGPSVGLGLGAGAIASGVSGASRTLPKFVDNPSIESGSDLLMSSAPAVLGTLGLEEAFAREGGLAGSTKPTHPLFGEVNRVEGNPTRITPHSDPRLAELGYTQDNVYGGVYDPNGVQVGKNGTPEMRAAYQRMQEATGDSWRTEPMPSGSDETVPGYPSIPNDADLSNFGGIEGLFGGTGETGAVGNLARGKVKNLGPIPEQINESEHIDPFDSTSGLEDAKNFLSENSASKDAKAVSDLIRHPETKRALYDLGVDPDNLSRVASGYFHDVLMDNSGKGDTVVRTSSKPFDLKAGDKPVEWPDSKYVIKPKETVFAGGKQVDIVPALKKVVRPNAEQISALEAELAKEGKYRLYDPEGSGGNLTVIGGKARVVDPGALVPIDVVDRYENAKGVAGPEANRARKDMQNYIRRRGNEFKNPLLGNFDRASERGAVGDLGDNEQGAVGNLGPNAKKEFEAYLYKKYGSSWKTSAKPVELNMYKRIVASSVNSPKSTVTNVDSEVNSALGDLESRPVLGNVTEQQNTNKPIPVEPLDNSGNEPLTAEPIVRGNGPVGRPRKTNNSLPSEPPSINEPKPEGPIPESRVHRVRLDNDQVVKINAHTPEEAIQKVNDYYDSKGITVRATEAIGVPNQLERGASGEAGFEKQSKQIQKESDQANAIEARERVRNETRSQQEIVQQINKLEQAQAREENINQYKKRQEEIDSLRQQKRLADKIEREQVREQQGKEKFVQKLKYMSEREKAAEVRKEAKQREKLVQDPSKVTESDTFLQGWDKLDSGQKVVEAGNIIRAAKSSLDTPVLRQGRYISFNDPVLAAKAAKAMSKTVFSKEQFDKLHSEIASDKTFNQFKKYGTGFVPDMPGITGRREEAFPSPLAEKIPGLGKGVIAPSDRAYTAFMNSIRLGQWKKSVGKLLDKGVTPQLDPQAFKDLARVTNLITFRGDSTSSLVKRLASSDVVGNVLYSPRNKASQVQILKQMLWSDLSTKGGLSSPRFQLKKTIAQTWAINAALYGTLAYAGLGTIEKDPESSDFLKLKVGDKRYNPWMGTNQLIRAAFLAATGKGKTTTGKGFKSDLYDLTLGKQGELRKALAPAPGLLTDLVTGRSLSGEEVRNKKSPAEQQVFDSAYYMFTHGLTPMSADDIVKEFKNSGFSSLLTVGLPSFAGENVSVYDKPKKSSRGIYSEEEQGSLY